MKQIKHYILVCAVLLFSGGCDQDFIEVNTNPYAVTAVDLEILFAGAQRSHLGTWTAEHVIVQQFVVPYNEGATTGFSFHVDVDGVSNSKWNASYTGPVRNLVHALNSLGEDTERVNLLSMIRIWKAQVFMGLVDAYGDVPYFDAGKAVSDADFEPVYDDDEVIYTDLLNELREAVAALDPGADYVSADLFYGANAEVPTATSAEQVEKWRKLGNSLLLRLGMRYSKVNPSLAQSIVAEAFAGGVMTSNADNAFVKYDGSTYVQTENNGLRNFSQYHYATEPFVNQLKSTNDPRGPFIVAAFSNPGALANDPNPDTNLANQYGVPIGVDNYGVLDSLRGARGTGLDYSQMNVNSVASPAAPDFYVTYAQTSLLLAEAAQRGWVAGSAATYYENGIRANMEVYELYPPATPISDGAINDYLAHPAVDFSEATTNEEAFALINTQYWVVNIRNGAEAFANFRRSGYPALTPNPTNPLPGSGFIRRLLYPDREAAANTDNFLAASAAMGGDNFGSRVFWDIP